MDEYPRLMGGPNVIPKRHTVKEGNARVRETGRCYAAGFEDENQGQEPGNKATSGSWKRKGIFSWSLHA